MTEVLAKFVVDTRWDDLPPQVTPELRGLLATLTSVLLEALVEQHSARVVLGGTANLTENAMDFPAIRPVLGGSNG